MERWALITQLASNFRDFVAPRYRPELYYMRGPGPASARRASTRAEGPLRSIAKVVSQAVV
jgi:hypothetical protein